MRDLKESSMFGSLKIAEFRALWLGETFSVFGDQVARVALALLVFEQTSSAALTALTYGLTFVPAVLGGLLLSGLADKYPRKRVIVVTDLVRAGLAGLMAVPGLPLAVLWGFIALLTLASAPFKAAQLALLPQVLSKERYQAGLALRQMSSQTAQIVGFGGGGLLIAALNVNGALLLNALTFLLSALLVARGVRSRPAARSNVPSSTAGSTEKRFDARLIAPFLLAALIGLLVVPEGLAAPYASAMGTASFSVGILMAADPVGSVLGAWWAARTADGTPSAPAVVVPAAAAALPLVACFFLPEVAWAVTFWAISGALSTLYLIRIQAVVVAIVPDDRRGTVMGRLSTCLYTAQGLAIVGGGVAAEHYGPVAAVGLAGASAFVLTLGAAAFWRFARPRQADGAEDEQAAVSTSEQGSQVLIAHHDPLPEHPAGGRPAAEDVREPGSRPSAGNGKRDHYARTR